MSNRTLRWFCTALLALSSLPGWADRGFDELALGREALHLAPPDSSEHRKYAPDREVDLLHLALDVTPDFKQRSVAGQVVLTFKPIAKPLRELKLDAESLAIASVTAAEPIQGWQNTGKKLVVTFAQAIAAGREAKVTVAYSAEPRRGLYFRTPEMGYKAGETHLFTQGEEIEARHWYPCIDAPNEKFTAEVTCRVPEGMTVLSNGKRVSEAKDPQTGLVAVRWLQDKPHANYLVALAAGYFKKVEDTYRDIPLTFYTLPSAFPEAPGSFRDTKDMMAFFEQEIGVPYPWAKYAQVCVNDFVAGGMENTSLTILTDGTLFPETTENIRSSQGLVAHELAHMWFGDLVTCKDWSHVWLNEGFATYYEALYDGHKNGRDAFLYNLYNDARGFLDVPNDTKPIVTRRFDDPGEQFSFLAYPKGAWVVHMLRSQLGEDLYRRCIQTYLERHAYGNVVTEDLNAVIEELSGRSFDQFFDQWVYHAHQPELEIAYSWDEPTRLAKLNVKQVQAPSEQVLLFNFPLPVRFQLKTGATNRVVTVKEREEDFYFPLPEAPELVRIDPDYTVLAKVRFSPPPPMLQAMLAATNDVMARLLAVAQLSGRKDHDAVTKLKAALNQDPFHGVRIEAARALRAAHTDEALEALLASTPQADARVRLQVREALSGFYRESVLASTRDVLQSEKNPDILAAAIRALAPFNHPETEGLLLQYLQSDSYQNLLADAAVDAIRAQEDPAYLAPLLETLKRREAAFTSHGFAAGLSTLAQVARNEDQKGSVREFLVGQVNHPKRSVQRAAIAALGTLGDSKAIPVLETFAHAAKDSPERQAAERAIASLRAAKKPVDDFRELRNEVMGLQKENRDLKREFEELRKKVGELAPPRPPDKPADPKKKKK